MEDDDSATRTAAIVLVIVAIVALLVVAGFWQANKSSGVTLQGTVLASDPGMIYEGGTPDAAPGGFKNGCHGAGLDIGQTVTIETTQGKPIATGTITETFNWEGSPTLRVDRSNHGCSFTYVAKDVPKMDAYDILVGIVVSAHDVSWNSLDVAPSGGDVYLVPPIYVGS